ncbi:hypothetical protein QMZ30_14455 [Pantoea sp. EA-12]|uniref:hypothetical protein n=1 Tax=Pantoea sp. EA-12 TaxID=3043303 RepID=UPI0024B53251|nr:hypothetical protein [Pantoea sp. EA-12]MDI9222105.1 hypothetical protein [Pantoea sp. EA-12]
MENKLSHQPTAPLMTGIIGEAVLELVQRSMAVNTETIVIMLEKKKKNCQIPALIKVINDALFWLKKG